MTRKTVMPRRTSDANRATIRHFVKLLHDHQIVMNLKIIETLSSSWFTMLKVGRERHHHYIGMPHADHGSDAPRGLSDERREILLHILREELIEKERDKARTRHPGRTVRLGNARERYLCQRHGADKADLQAGPVAVGNVVWEQKGFRIPALPEILMEKIRVRRIMSIGELMEIAPSGRPDVDEDLRRSFIWDAVRESDHVFLECDDVRTKALDPELDGEGFVAVENLSGLDLTSLTAERPIGAVMALVERVISEGGDAKTAHEAIRAMPTRPELNPLRTDDGIATPER